MVKEWSIDSWKSYGCQQLTFYPFLSEEVQAVSSSISKLPTLTTISEIINLESQLLRIANGEALLLHCGTCAEIFAQSNISYVKGQLELIDTLADVISKSKLIPVIKIARLAGQFGKPRSDKIETVGDNTLLNYFGDIINGQHFSDTDRQPRAENMLIAYGFSSKMTTYVNDHINKKNNIKSETHRTYLSHEAFLLPYEAALTRQSFDGQWFNLGTHLPWLGKRSIYYNSPHIEYIRGIINPIGIKLSVDLSPMDLVNLIKYINPLNKPAKIVLIHRFGINNIKKFLPRYLVAIQKEKLNVIWIVDPMHGNTEIINNSRKFRNINNIISECIAATEIHQNNNSYLAGIHLECTSDNVLECANDSDEVDLMVPYSSAMDPRLNSHQSIEVIKKTIANEFFFNPNFIANLDSAYA